MNDPASAPRYSTLLRPLQDAVTDRLASFAPFAAVSVFDRRRHNLASDILAAKAKLGLYLYVYPPLPRAATSGSGAWFEEIEIAVHIAEKPAVNRTGVDAYDAAELIMQRLDGFRPDNCPNALYLAANPLVDVSDDELLMFDVLFHTKGGLSPAPDLS